MAKNYIKGAAYRLYLNTGTYASPTWAEIKAAGDISLDLAPTKIPVEERGIDTGYLAGENEPSISFTLMEDTGDANVVAMITAINDKTMKEIAVANGPIATSGTKFWRMESLLTAPLSAARGDVASYEVTANRHPNSDYGITRTTVS